ncbi:hypothetical protein ABK040_013795 [Willaertia magna]
MKKTNHLLVQEKKEFNSQNYGKITVKISVEKDKSRLSNMITLSFQSSFFHYYFTSKEIVEEIKGKCRGRKSYISLNERIVFESYEGSTGEIEEKFGDHFEETKDLLKDLLQSIGMEQSFDGLTILTQSFEKVNASRDFWVLFV